MKELPWFFIDRRGIYAGRFTLGLGRVILHLAPKPAHRMWGFHREEWDYSMHYFGLGPLFLIVW